MIDAERYSAGFPTFEEAWNNVPNSVRQQMEMQMELNRAQRQHEQWIRDMLGGMMKDGL